MSDDNLQAQLAAIKAFIASPAYSSYLATIRADLRTVEDSIIARPPATQEDIADLLMLHGERSRLLEAEKFFEDARETLESRLEELESEQPKREIV